MPNQPPPARRTLVAAYVLLAAAGFAALLWPTPSVGSAGRGVSDVWATFLATGGVLSAVGAARRTWFAEWVGLPLLATVWAVYGLAAAWLAATQTRPTSVPAALAFTGVAALIVARWVLVDIHRRAANQVARRGRP